MKKSKFESIQEKATRLREHRRVIVIGHTRVLVIGDHDTYIVAKEGLKWTCDCKWGRRHHGPWKGCSHIVAARQARKDLNGQAVVARLADWLMEANVG